MFLNYLWAFRMESFQGFFKVHRCKSLFKDLLHVPFGRSSACFFQSSFDFPIDSYCSSSVQSATSLSISAGSKLCKPLAACWRIGRAWRLPAASRVRTPSGGAHAGDSAGAYDVTNDQLDQVPRCHKWFRDIAKWEIGNLKLTCIWN